MGRRPTRPVSGLISISRRSVDWRVGPTESRRIMWGIHDRAHLDERDVLAAFCRQRHISRLAVFGSATREDFRPDSDVDVLVEFDEGHVPGLDFMMIERELSELVGHHVDLITPKFLIPRIFEQVLSSIRVLYTAT
jgi:uncharacterized protein